MEWPQGSLAAFFLSLSLAGFDFPRPVINSRDFVHVSFFTCETYRRVGTELRLARSLGLRYAEASATTTSTSASTTTSTTTTITTTAPSTVKTKPSRRAQPPCMWNLCTPCQTSWNEAWLAAMREISSTMFRSWQTALVSHYRRGCQFQCQASVSIC